MSGSIMSGSIMVLGRPDSPPATNEVIREVPKEVTKEVAKEVTKTVTAEIVSPNSYAIVGIEAIITILGMVISRSKKT